MASPGFDDNVEPPSFLPLECLAVVIDYTEEPDDLFAFLTVSKSAFWLAASKLYSNPFALRPWSSDSVAAFARLVLSLSPVVNEAIQALRAELHIDHPPENALFIDYLSLMRNVMFPMRHDPAWLYRAKDIRPALVYAAVGHRLAEVKEIAITDDYLDIYTGALRQLTSLERVKFAPKSSLKMQGVLRFVQQYVDHFGARGQRLKVDISNILSQDRAIVLETLSLVDSICTRPREITAKNALHYIAQRDGVDFGHVSTISWNISGEERHLLDMLPKCRSLRSLDMRLYNNDYRALGWALDESWSAQAVPPPLESLTISGLPAGTMYALNDGLKGFGHTLQEVHVMVDPYMGEGVFVLVIESGLYLPRLRHLTITYSSSKVCVALPANSVPRMQLLERLVVFGNYRGSDHDQFQGMHQLDPLSLWGQLHLPCLTHLHLTHRAVLEFNPASLRSMTCLLNIHLSLPYAWRDQWLGSRWRWEWFPRVKSLTLEGLVASQFHMDAFQALRGLENLSLNVWEGRLSWTAPQEDGIESGDRHGMGGSPIGPVLSRTLRTLTLYSFSQDIDDTVWECILGSWFPQLTKLEVGGMGLRRSETLATTLGRRHPRLASVNNRPLTRYRAR